MTCLQSSMSLWVWGTAGKMEGGKGEWSWKTGKQWKNLYVSRQPPHTRSECWHWLPHSKGRGWEDWCSKISVFILELEEGAAEWLVPHLLEPGLLISSANVYRVLRQPSHHFCLKYQRMIENNMNGQPRITRHF